jgi:hypothetical protein
MSEMKIVKCEKEMHNTRREKIVLKQQAAAVAFQRVENERIFFI